MARQKKETAQASEFSFEAKGNFRDYYNFDKKIRIGDDVSHYPVKVLKSLQSRDLIEGAEITPEVEEQIEEAQRKAKAAKVEDSEYSDEDYDNDNDPNSGSTDNTGDED